MNETIVINQISYNIEEILQDCWHLLINGANSSRHPFHSPSVATINSGSPEIRTIILRKAIPEEKTLIFYTDYRSPKVSQIKLNNQISWLFYDAKSRIQLRIKTDATIYYKDEISLKSWNDLRLESRKCYLVHPATSKMSITPTDGLPEHFNCSSLTEESVAHAYENFAVIRNIVKEIDWLFLKHDGHRRAQFIIHEHEVEKHWLIP